MTNTAGIPGDRICSFVERVERIDEEIKALNEGKKEVFAEAKGEGFDVKVFREILRLRKQDKDERDEQDSLLDLIPGLWRARACRKQGRRSAKPATNFRSLNQVCSHRTSITFNGFDDREGVLSRSHSSSFDRRRRPETLRTAMEIAFFWPTRTTSLLPRVTPV
jgi:uncharacterized protein (UPF0335 family)